MDYHAARGALPTVMEVQKVFSHYWAPAIRKVFPASYQAGGPRRPLNTFDGTINGLGFTLDCLMEGADDEDDFNLFLREWPRALGGLFLRHFDALMKAKECVESGEVMPTGLPLGLPDGAFVRLLDRDYARRGCGASFAALRSQREFLSKALQRQQTAARKGRTNTGDAER